MEWRSESLGPSCPNAPSFHYGGSPLDPAGLGLSSSMIAKKKSHRFSVVNLMVNLFWKISQQSQAKLSHKWIQSSMDVLNVGRHSATTKFSPKATISPIPSGFFPNLWIQELGNVAIPFDERFHGAFSLNLGGNLPVKSHYQGYKKRIFPIRRYTGNVREKKLSNCDAFPHPTM